MSPESLPPDLAHFVDQQVAAGKYASPAEAICEGVRLLQEREQRLTELRSELLPSIERLDRGEGIELDAEVLKAELHHEFEQTPSVPR